MTREKTVAETSFLCGFRGKGESSNPLTHVSKEAGNLEKSDPPVRRHHPAGQPQPGRSVPHCRLYCGVRPWERGPGGGQVGPVPGSPDCRYRTADRVQKHRPRPMGGGPGDGAGLGPHPRRPPPGAGGELRGPARPLPQGGGPAGGECVPLPGGRHH